MSKPILSLLLLSLFIFVACADSGSSDDADGDVFEAFEREKNIVDGDEFPEQDNSEIPTTDGDTTIPVDGDEESEVSESEVEAEKEVSDTTEEEEAVPCSCTTIDECCDGCHPKNELGACETGNKCVTNACLAGRCKKVDEKECKASDVCKKSTCNPSTGQCNETFKEQYEECEATPGNKGSGLCINNQCLNFGACDSRHYNQFIHMPCNFDGECEGGICVRLGKWNSYCSRPCGEDLDECPSNMGCSYHEDHGKICQTFKPSSIPPGNGQVQLFRPCNKDEDCAGGLCLAYDDKKFCTQQCAGENDQSCGACGRCRHKGTSNIKYDYYCTGKGSNSAGMPCQLGSDCSSGYCLGNYCTKSCGSITNFCPLGKGMVCQAGVHSTSQICINPEDLNRKFGESCVEDWSCTSGKCKEILGKKICVETCSSTITCAQGTCDKVYFDDYKREEVNYSPEQPKSIKEVEDSRSSQNVCVPDALRQNRDFGQSCEQDFECKENLDCYAGSCNATCNSPACTTGECYMDIAYQGTQYCSKKCNTHTDCPEAMGCLDGQCVLNFKPKQTLYGFCRMDDDCETGSCVDTYCAEPCGKQKDCDGSWKLDKPDEDGQCWPCDPDDYTACGILDECVTGTDGSSYCAKNCGYEKGVCVAGTRCMPFNNYTSVCMPITGTCSNMATCNSANQCIKPYYGRKPCKEDAECSSGNCQNDFCQPFKCKIDSDCYCDSLECDGEFCQPKEDLYNDNEVEPNDSLSSATLLDTFPALLKNQFVSKNGVADVDLFQITLSANQGMDVMTKPFCMENTNTFLSLLDSSGDAIPDWQNDDMGQGYYFSILFGYKSEVDQTVFVEVSQSPYVVPNLRSNYILDIDVFDLVDNNECDNAPLLTAGTHNLDIAGTINSYAASSCTGQPGIGKDIAYQVKLPAMSLLTAGVAAEFDSSIYVVTDCSDTNGTCLAGADRFEKGEAEEVIYANETDKEMTLFVIIDSWLIEGSTAFDLTIAIDSISVPANDKAENATEITQSMLIKGTIIAANNDYDPTKEGCLKKDVPGKDVVYKFDLEDGGFANFTIQKYNGFAPVMYITTDYTTLDECITGSLNVTVTNDTGATETYYLIVDSTNIKWFGTFEIAAAIGCSGACNPNSYGKYCPDTTNICVCDNNSQQYIQVDCDAYCKDKGQVAGTCHEYTVQYPNGFRCMCEYDCTKTTEVSEACTSKAYNNCTCDPSDPCGYTSNSKCDEACHTEYDSHLDDSAECTTTK